MRLGRHREGFSLLELMLVLVVMIGVMALVWPAVARSVASSEIRDAARQLRERLVEARREAMDSGQPVLVRISPGGRFVKSAAWREAIEFPEVLADPLGSNPPLESNASGGSAGSIASPASTGVSGQGNPAAISNVPGLGSAAPLQLPRAWELPGEIVIADLRRSGTSPHLELDDMELSESSLDSRSSSSSASRSSSSRLSQPSRTRDTLSTQRREGAPTTGTSVDIDSDTTLDELGIAAGGWLWFLPHGQGPTAELVLFDPQSQREVIIRMDGWTGAIEIERDQRRAPVSLAGEVPLER